MVCCGLERFSLLGKFFQFSNFCSEGLLVCSLFSVFSKFLDGIEIYVLGCECVFWVPSCLYSVCQSRPRSQFVVANAV